MPIKFARGEHVAKLKGLIPKIKFRGVPWWSSGRLSLPRAWVQLCRGTKAYRLHAVAKKYK